MGTSNIRGELVSAALVGVGAALGACARFGIQALFCDPLWPLFGINMVACLAMGFFRPKLFWGKGVLGGFSSFSAVVVLAYHVPLAAAAGYLALTICGALGAWAIGDAAANLRERAQGGDR